MKSLFLLVSMLFLAHLVAAGIPAVAKVLIPVGSLHEVHVLLVTMLFLAHHVPAGIPAVGVDLNAVCSLHQVPVFACDHAVSGAPCSCWHPCYC
jgi:hypothetical protein